MAELRRHLQVEPGLHGGDPVVHRSPVGHHHAVIPPLVTEDLGQQPPVLGHVRAERIERVVNALPDNCALSTLLEDLLHPAT